MGRIPLGVTGQSTWNDMLSTMTESFVGTALWSSIDDDGEPLDDRFDVNDVVDDGWQVATSFCKRFLDAAVDSCRSVIQHADPSDLGHYLWLSANGHGSDFSDWDGAPREVLDKLNEIARSMGGLTCYECDEGCVSISST